MAHRGDNKERGGRLGKTVSPRELPEPEGGYKAFEVSKLFTIKSPKKKFNANNLSFGGHYPYVARGASNNGIRGYVDLDPQFLNEANTFSFGQDTATVFYQKEPYFTGDKIKIMSLRYDELDDLTSCYLIAAIRKAFQCFSWGVTSFNEKVIKSTKLILPCDVYGNPNFAYMHSCMHELEKERMHKLDEYLDAVGFKDCTLSENELLALKQIETVEMLEAKIGGKGGVFDIATGRDVIIGQTREGNIPLISHQHDNNGVSKYVHSIPNRRIFNHKSTIPLADRGVFLATIQCKDFHIGTRVKALTFKSGEKSENVRLFFIAAINKLQIKFTEYLTNATDSLPYLTIQLPIKNNKIDYELMETYIQAVKKECIAKLKTEINRGQKYTVKQ